jgi:hypothetical protein
MALLGFPSFSGLRVLGRDRVTCLIVVLSIEAITLFVQSSNICVFGIYFFGICCFSFYGDLELVIWRVNSLLYIVWRMCLTKSIKNHDRLQHCNKKMIVIYEKILGHQHSRFERDHKHVDFS